MSTLTYRDVNRDILLKLEPPGWRYFALLALAVAAAAWGFYSWMSQVYTGLGVTGLAHPVKWGVYITSFVFWVGIAHAGTLISAILLLLRARWRTAVSRSAEAMTVFAISTAGLFPLIHLGRPWFFYWLIPYPNQRQLWVNFRSPLIWDVFAVGTYFVVSLLFLYLGLIPDLAAARDRGVGWRRKFYAALSLGWQASDREWKHYGASYLFLAALATPLVVSVHSVVSWDFASALVPGWHSTIFAPYFVTGAIFSGLAMVLTLLIPLRKFYGLEGYILPRHFENLAKLLIATSLIITYAYALEFFTAWYSGNPFEKGSYWNRAFGPYAGLFWLVVVCNSGVPLTLFAKRVRTNTVALFVISILINIGMWLERFVIIVGSLSHEFVPYAWGLYAPSWTELSILVGSFGWFFAWFLLFIKLFPVLSIVEVKEVLPRPRRGGGSP